MKQDITHRRKVRAMEAKRDQLMESMNRQKVALAETRAALKAMKNGRR